MSYSILTKDIDLNFPSILILKASAGSGKTHALAKRFIQFILSNRVNKNNLRNILAITFSNNAAKEMKHRILNWLKEIYFRDEKKISEIREIVSLDEESLVNKAETIINEIILNYTDFQVKTIDSFMSSIYKSSAIDLGFSPDFEIIISEDQIINHAYYHFLRSAKSGSAEIRFLEDMLELILEARDAESSYLWDPSKIILNEIKELYRKLSGIVKDALIKERKDYLEAIKFEISRRANELQNLIKESNLKKNEKSSFEEILNSIKKGDFPSLIRRGLSSSPVAKPKDGENNPAYQNALKIWEDLCNLISEYSKIFSFIFYIPYLKIFHEFQSFLEEIKRGEGVLFIDNINKNLSRYLSQEIVPDVYFKIGDTIYHYLIDEFQDTSPIQWINLFPLIENSLAQGGTLFAVGDTKQAIYGFRNADYRIMKDLESFNPFPSASHEVKELKINYRSLEEIVRFSEDFFKKIISLDKECWKAAKRSGLADYIQEVKEEHKAKGYVEIGISEMEKGEASERERLKIIIKDLKDRGYRYSDIAILTKRNEDVVNLSMWLNEIDVNFISYSNLDIRKRKLADEIFRILAFLDSPPDDFSFGSFLLGEVFRNLLNKRGVLIDIDEIHRFIFKNRSSPPLYKRFQEQYPSLWNTYFDKIFSSVGYLPLYDLVCEIYKTFDVFENFYQEEATLVKILEIIKNLENRGLNDLGILLKIAREEMNVGEEWNIDIPDGIDAIKVMTIHKAKGLQFPVVILVIYGEQKRGFKYIIDEREEGVYLLKINREIAKLDKSLKDAYDNERLSELVNSLNLLYVAFTRAERELYILGVSSKRKQFPLNLLKEVSFKRMKKEFPKVNDVENVRFLELFHIKDKVDFNNIAWSCELNLEERKRGEFIHRVLYFIEYLEKDIEFKLKNLIIDIKQELNIQIDVDLYKEHFLKFLYHKEIMPYFQWREGRTVKREQKFSDPYGNLFRMDRVIIDVDKVFVIDYKTGMKEKDEEAYVSQIKNYINILKDIFKNKSVEGIIAYFDLIEVVKLS